MKKASGRPRPAIGAGLLLMSIGSGCMDVVSYRSLGEVFPSAMTGNTALMGAALGAGHVAAALHNLCALACFFGGALTGACLLRRQAMRGRLLLAVGLQCVLLLAVVLLWPSRGGARDGAWGLYGLIGLAAWAMGMQSAVAHRVGVRGVSTTYFTGTLANIAFGLVEPQIAADEALPPVRRVGWPALALLAYFGGAALAGFSPELAPGLMPWAVGMEAAPLVATVAVFGIMAFAGPRAGASPSGE